MVKPSLRFTRKCYAAWQQLCKIATTEIGAYGWCANEKDPLLVTGLWVPKQVCTGGSVDREADQGAMNLYEASLKGLHAGQCSRVWLHTHPGGSATPSCTDEKYWRHFTMGEEYEGVPGTTQHGHVMGIMAKGGATFARLAIRDPEYWLDLDIDVQVVDEDISAITKWAAEQVRAKVTERKYSSPYTSTPSQNFPTHYPLAGAGSTSVVKATRSAGMSKQEHKIIKDLEKRAATFGNTKNMADDTITPLNQKEWDRYHELDELTHHRDLTQAEMIEWGELDSRAEVCVALKLPNNVP